MDLVTYAHESGLAATQRLSREERKRLGQFLTPPAIARFMAAQACMGLDKASVNVLEPAAGTGILAAAVVEQLVSHLAARKLEITLCELDSRLEPALLRLADRMRRFAKARGATLKVRVVIGDFLLSEIAAQAPRFDLVIANPPYFKISKSDPRARRHAYAVHGQPNVYALFMAACARALIPGGRWCFITPRSWTNGAYFAAARREILRVLRIDSMHIFESREAHFTDDEVLQEAMITWATVRDAAISTITLSTSQGLRDLPDSKIRAVPSSDIIGSDSEGVISLPVDDCAHAIRSLSASLGSHGIKVSTGPVVAFRATEHLRDASNKRTVPLLWMQHIRHMAVYWPLQRKREHIQCTADTAWMMVPNANMVLARRFSPKEDERRVTAAPYLARSLPGEFLGLENHTNYFYRTDRVLSIHETRGLAAFLNSRTVDAYLRSVAGNTQVNAADFRALPLPDHARLVEIGRRVREGCSLEEVDRAVESVLDNNARAVAA